MYTCSFGEKSNLKYGPIELFLVPAMLQDWYNKGRGMSYPVCGIVHIKEPLLLIGKSSPCSGSGFSSLALSEWSIFSTPLVLSVSLKGNMSLLPTFCYFVLFRCVAVQSVLS